MNVHDQVAHYGLTADEIMDLAGAIAAEQFKRDGLSAVGSPESAIPLFQKFLAGRAEEVFAVAFLDNGHRLIKLENLFRGTVDAATVYPRVVAERALRYGAAAVIFAHNHPSGNGEPSLGDQSITRRLSDCLALFEIRVLDHLIIGAGQPVSMAARGMLGRHSGPIWGAVSEQEFAADEAKRAKRSERMKKAWVGRKARAAAKLEAAQ